MDQIVRSLVGSFGNRSDQPRRALVLNFFADGTKALMDGTLLKGAPTVAKGETLAGKFHPLVFDASRVDMASLPVASERVAREERGPRPRANIMTPLSPDLRHSKQ